MNKWKYKFFYNKYIIDSLYIITPTVKEARDIVNYYNNTKYKINCSFKIQLADPVMINHDSTIYELEEYKPRIPSNIKPNIKYSIYIIFN